MRSTSVCLWLLAWIFSVNPVCAASIPDDLKALHVLDRLAYGPSPGDVQKIRAMGINKYIEQQLAPGTIPLPEDLRRQLDGLDSLPLPAAGGDG